MTTIAIIGCGAMGAAVARRLTLNGVRVLTPLEGRGEASRERAAAAGMVDAGYDTILAEASLVLSIVPPADAEAVAARYAEAASAMDGAPDFVDCNAIGVPSMSRIRDAIEAAGASAIDCAIIGFPPKGEEAGPTFHFSGRHAASALSLGDHGLRVKLLDGPVGAASAFKLSYAGITKGLVAVASAMILAAEREGAGDALRAELAASQPQLLSRFQATLPDMFPKAARWVDEMRSIAAFVGPDYPESAIYEGAAGIYERLGADFADGGEETKAIAAFLSRKG